MQLFDREGTRRLMHGYHGAFLRFLLPSPSDRLNLEGSLFYLGLVPDLEKKMERSQDHTFRLSGNLQNISGSSVEPTTAPHF
jgi:hypothetical protein